jgi:hypothetical protein
MKIADVPPWRAYVCIAFLTEKTDGVLRAIESASREADEGLLHRLDKTFLVNWHLDRDMRKVLVDFWVRFWFYCGIVHGVLMVLGDRSKDEANIAYQLKAEELRGQFG